MAAASQRTSRIELGTAVIPQGWENPLRLAEDLARANRFAPDILGTSEPIAAALYTHAGFRDVKEVVFALRSVSSTPTTCRS
jgi:hypothetical protein